MLLFPRCSLVVLCFVFVTQLVAWTPPKRLSTSQSRASVQSQQQPKTLSQQTTKQYQHIFNTFAKYTAAAVLTAPVLLSSQPAAVYAQQGSIKPSTPQEVKAAIKQLKECLESAKTFKDDVSKGAYQAIGDKLSTSAFTTIDVAFTTIVRSDDLTQDEKTTLGTIRRFGIVADAIIMLGGLGGELRAGGVKVGGGGSSMQAGIEDVEEDSDSPVEINGSEVKRYVQLSIDALQDIYTLVKKLE